MMLSTYLNTFTIMCVENNNKLLIYRKGVASTSVGARDNSRAKERQFAESKPTPPQRQQLGGGESWSPLPVPDIEYKGCHLPLIT